jgi:hypothetical protein
MNHLNEEQLVLHYYGELADASVEKHLADCTECRAEYRALQQVLNTVDSAPMPERAADYGEAVWRRIEGRLGARRRNWFQRSWWALAPAAAMLAVVAFFAGRMSKQPDPNIAGNQARERILLVAVGDHLERSQMVLAELSNAPEGKGQVDISDERARAEDLLDDNRLYRQTAHTTGDTGVASVLDDLERVLMEIAHSPAELSSDQWEQLRQEIRDRGLLFKVRVIGSQVRERERAPQQSSSQMKDKRL